MTAAEQPAKGSKGGPTSGLHNWAKPKLLTIDGLVNGRESMQGIGCYSPSATRPNGVILPASNRCVGELGWSSAILYPRQRCLIACYTRVTR